MSFNMGSGPSITPPPLTPRQNNPRKFVKGRSAMLNTADGTRTYPCGSCGSNLVFDIASQKLRCPSCGNYHEITAPNTRIRLHELEPTMQQLRILQRKVDAPDVTGLLSVTCQNCGGRIEFIGSLTATMCPYCATPIQRGDVHQARARLAVDGVLPFAIDHNTTGLLVEKWIARRWFAPNDFKRLRHIGSFASLYTAYFAYDANADTWYSGERGTDVRVRTGTDSSGNATYRTEIRWRHVTGRVYNDFADRLALANDTPTLNPKLTTALEPWPVGRSRSYAPEFIAGHLCRTYDRDAEQSFPPVRDKMDEEIKKTVIANIGGDHQRVHGIDTNWKYIGFKHLLLPIWLLTVTYRGRAFQVYLNGFTGKVAGNRPYSPWKILFAVLTAALAIGAVVVVAGRPNGQSTPSSPTSPSYTTPRHYPTAPTYPQQSVYPPPPTYGAPPTYPAPPTYTAPPVYTAPPNNPGYGTQPVFPVDPNYPDNVGN